MIKTVAKKVGYFLFYSLALICCIFFLLGGICGIIFDTTTEDMAYINDNIEGVFDEEGNFRHENIPEGLKVEWMIDKENGNTATFSKGFAEVSYFFDTEGNLEDVCKNSTRQQELVKAIFVTVIFSFATFAILLTIIGEILSIKNK